MTRIEDLAELSVGRGCGFAAIGIATFMVGMSAQLALAFKAGGIALLIMCFVLVLKAWRAETSPYKRTEVWVMLRKDDRPQPAVAQKLIGAALRRVYLRYALRTGAMAAALLVCSLVLATTGTKMV